MLGEGDIGVLRLASTGFVARAWLNSEEDGRSHYASRSEKTVGESMSHRNMNGHHVPEHLWSVAASVHQLVSRDGVLDRWSGRIAEWLGKQAVEPGLDEQGYVRSPHRPAGEYAPLDFELHIEEKYAVLGAVHDFAASSGTLRR